jgi:hypothetical protein
MCCGAKRALARNSTTLVAQTLSRAAVAPATARPNQAVAPVLFEYTGKTRLTVVSPETGARYHFDRPGAQVSVAPRDQSMMVYVPGLRPVRFIQPS